MQNDQADEDQAPELKFLMSHVQHGSFDDQLDEIINECHARKKFVMVRAGHQLRAGDRVEFISGRPAYLVGQRATVVKVMQTWVNLRLDNNIGKFSMHGTVRTPMTIIKKIEVPA